MRSSKIRSNRFSGHSSIPIALFFIENPSYPGGNNGSIAIRKVLSNIAVNSLASNVELTSKLGLELTSIKYGLNLVSNIKSYPKSS